MSQFLRRVSCFFFVLAVFVMVLPNNMSFASDAPYFYWPLDTSIDLTTGFGDYTGHKGMDFSCAKGTEVYAAASGTVTVHDYGCTGSHYITNSAYACVYGTSCKAYQNSNILGSYGGFANYIEIDHGNGYYTRYAHMMSGSFTVKSGTWVEAGTFIGKTSNCGYTAGTTGYHLHFEVGSTENRSVRYDAYRNGWLHREKAGSGGGSVGYEIDGRYPTPFKAFTISTQNVECYNSVMGSRAGEIYPSDECIIEEIYTNGWCKVVCPWDNQPPKTVYVEKSVFLHDPNYIPNDQYLLNSTQGYIRKDMSAPYRWCDKQNNGQWFLRVGKTGPDGYTQIIYWIAGEGNFLMWIKHKGSANDSINIGSDFYAYIIDNATWRNVTNDGANVTLRSGTGDENQIWHFVYKGNGYYKIYNCADGNALDVEGAFSASGTNVQVYPTHDSAAQLWMICGRWNGEVTLEPKCSTCVLDVNGGSANTYEGVNIQIWEYNQTDAQKFAIWTDLPRTVTYDANGGSNPPAEITKQYRTSFSLSNDKPKGASYKITLNANGGTVSTTSKTVSRPFKNWNTMKDGSGTPYSAGANFTIRNNTVLYAQWYRATAGTLATPTRTNYTFTGWYTSASGGEKIESSSIISTDTTLYAHWTHICTSGHSYSYKATKNPTTSATGTLTGTCSKCSGTTTVTLPKLNTTDYTKTTTKAATCTATGTDSYKWKTTTYGTFTFTATTAAKGHTPVTDKAVAATCTAEGKTEGSHCSVCNAVIKAQTTVAALGHSYISKVTAPTCTTQGYTTYTCSRCSHSYKDNYTNATNHSYSYKATKNPTTSATGTLTGTCSKCSGTTTVTLPKLNTTDYTKTTTKTATCTATGTDSYKWKTTTYGTFTFTATTAAKGHTPVTDKAVAATCTATGLTEGTHCSVCNEVIKAQTTVAALGHSFTLLFISDSQHRCVCGRCDQSSTESHNFVYSSFGNNERHQRSCECGYSDKTEGHAYTFSSASTEEHSRSCKKCGFEDSANHSLVYYSIDDTNHKQYCKWCPYEEIVNHKWDSGSITQASTCVAGGEIEYACIACAHARTEVVVALGHSYTSKVTDPTCDAQGYTTYVCSRCSHGYKDNYTNATNHSYSYKVTKYPTTSATGTLTGTCSKCSGTTTVTLPKLNTTDYTKTTTTAATCTATGTDSYEWKTTTYGTFTFTVTTAAKGHTSVTDKAVAATCTATGLTEGSHCSVCNVMIKAQTTVAALGHSYTSKVTDPTCNAQGYTTYVCSRCSHSYKNNYTNPINHSYSYKVTKYPATSATGTLTGTCSKCSGSTTVTLPKMNTTEYTTYTEFGVEKYTWKNTEYGTFSFAVTVYKSGHEFTDYKRAIEPTTSATGELIGNCRHCKEIDSVTLPVLNDTDYTKSTYPVSCTKNGADKYTWNNTTYGYLTFKVTIYKLGHSYTYTDKGESHEAVCGVCEHSVTEAHSYADNVCVCGVREVLAPITDESVAISHSLNLASDISINYAVKADLIAAYDSFRLEVQRPVYNGNALTGVTTVMIDPVRNGSYYYFTMSDITAVNMNDTLVATLHMTKGNQEYVSKPDSYSIVTYALNQLNKTSAAKKMKVLCADLLRYGAAAQKYKRYRTDAEATMAMTDAHKALLSDLNAVTFGNTNTVYNDLANPMITWEGKILSLDSKVVVKFVFNAGAYTGNISNLTLRMVYQDNSGIYRTVTLSNPEVYNEGKRQYAFAFDGLMAAELRTAMSVAVYSGDTQLSQTLQYSIDTYGSNKTGVLGELCKALFAYSDSAKAYFS